MTTAGFVSGTRDETSPTPLSRLAAGASLILGLALVGVLPAVADAAFYVGVLGATSAALAIVSGFVLWARPTLLTRATVALAAAGTLAAELLQVSEGLPGARQLGRLTPVELWTVGGFATVVLVLLLLDARRRHPEQAPEHPYAL